MAYDTVRLMEELPDTNPLAIDVPEMNRVVDGFLRAAS